MSYGAPYAGPGLGSEFPGYTPYSQERYSTGGLYDSRPPALQLEYGPEYGQEYGSPYERPFSSLSYY